MSSESVTKQYEKYVGMPPGKANHLLKKQLFWSYADKLDLLNCFRCHKKIETAEEISIDHKDPWRNISGKLFWDLDNIALSHRKCNIIDRPARKIGPEGTSWCAKHKEFMPVNKFGYDSTRWNRLKHLCLECMREKWQRNNQKNPRFPCPECKHLMRKKCGKCGFALPYKEYVELRRKEGATY